MARTLILNISETGQTLPAVYGGFLVAVGHGRVVSDETSVAVGELGGFAAMDGKWVVYPVSTDTLEGDFDVAANGVAMLATFIPGGGGGGGGGPVDWASILNKPSFSDVATSGSYNDLIDTPAPFSGDYADLTNKPVIPAASNVTATDVGSSGSAGVLATFSRADHQHSHGTQGGGSLHAAATTVSAGFMSAADKSKLDGLAAVATSGSYTDLTNKPALFDGAYSSLTGKPPLFDGDYNSLVNKPSLFDGAYASLTGKPSLAAVATSGSYTDLTDKPSIPTLPTLAAVATSGSYNDLTNKPDLSAYLTSVATANINDAAVTNAKIASVAASKVTGLAAVATSGNASDLSNQPYDIIGDATGTLAVGKEISTIIAPRALVLTAIQQSAAPKAQVVVKVNGTNASYPQSVAAGAVLTIVVTTAGDGAAYAITGRVA